MHENGEVGEGEEDVNDAEDGGEVIFPPSVLLVYLVHVSSL